MRPAAHGIWTAMAMVAGTAAQLTFVSSLLARLAIFPCSARIAQTDSVLVYIAPRRVHGSSTPTATTYSTTAKLIPAIRNLAVQVCLDWQAIGAETERAKSPR